MRRLRFANGWKRIRVGLASSNYAANWSGPVLGMEWNGDQPFFEGRTEDWTGGGGGTAIPYQHQKTDGTDGNGKLRALRRPAKRDANHKNLMKLQVIETMKILREV